MQFLRLLAMLLRALDQDPITLDERAILVEKYASAYVDLDRARDHAYAAAVAANAFNVDPTLILAIAWHESRFEQKAVTVEIGHKLSCGVMTPVPSYDPKACSLSTASLMAGYIAGAEHLRGWLNVCRGNERCALLGYAGGGLLIRACRIGSVFKTRGSRTYDVCFTPEVFRSIAMHFVVRSDG